MFTFVLVGLTGGRSPKGNPARTQQRNNTDLTTIQVNLFWASTGSKIKSDMALIQCKECGHEVSDKASACPNCGYPIGKRNYCVECGQLIPEGVNVCPNCGCPTQDNRTHGFEPPKKSKGGLIWLLSILFLAILFFAILLGGGYHFFNKTNRAAGEIVYEISIDSLLADGQYTFNGNWESSRYSAQPCKLEFKKNGKDLKKCAYTNLKFNTRIPLNGTIQNDTLHFVGDISGKQLVINLKISSDGNILVGDGIDYAHGGDKAELTLTKVEFAKLKAIELVLPHGGRKTITDNGSNNSKDRIILDDENDNYNNATASSTNGSCSSKGYRFSSPQDVIGWLADKSFFNGSRRLRIRPEGVWLNDYCATGAPNVERWESW